MDAQFNPYHEWLGIDPRIQRPNHYELLSLEPAAASLEAVMAAADRAMSRVRSFRPGPHAALWAKLLDEISTARRCLTTPVEKESYDRSLGQTHSPQTLPATAKAPPVPNGNSAIAGGQPAPTAPNNAAWTPPGMSGFYPPGMTPQAVAGSLNPMAPMSMHAGPMPSAAMQSGPMQPSPMQPSPMQLGASQPGPMPPAAWMFPPTAAMGNAPNPMAPAGMSSMPMQSAQYPQGYGAINSGYGSPAMSPGMMPPGAFPPAAMPQSMAMPSPAAPYANPMSPNAALPAVSLPPAAMMPSAPYAPMPGNVPMGQIVNLPPGAEMPQVALGIPVGASYGQPSAAAPMPMNSPPSSPPPVPPAIGVAAAPILKTGGAVSGIRKEQRQNQFQMPVLVGIAGLLLAGIVGIIWTTMGSKPSLRDEMRNVATNQPHSSSLPPEEPLPKEPTNSLPSVPEPEPMRPMPPVESPVNKKKKPSEIDAPNPDTKMNLPPVVPPIKPVEPPPPKPKPEPEPKPEPKPEPTPPKPEPKPEPPKPTVMPKREEVQQLQQALEKARTALSEFNVAEADDSLKKVEKLPMMSEHAAKFERAKMLVHYNSEFLRAMREAASGLKAGANIQIGNTVAAVVETFPNQDKIILRIAGMNRTFEYKTMPVGLANALASTWLDKNAASSLLVRASFVMVNKKSNDDMQAKAKEWLDEAKKDATVAEAISAVSPAFNESYDLLKDFSG